VPLTLNATGALDAPGSPGAVRCDASIMR